MLNEYSHLRAELRITVKDIRSPAEGRIWSSTSRHGALSIYQNCAVSGRSGKMKRSEMFREECATQGAPLARRGVYPKLCDGLRKSSPERVVGPF